jgi:AraC-like DNA-binding protein
MTAHAAFPSAAFREAVFAMPAGSRWSGHGHECWHLLQVERGGFEEAVGDHGVQIGAGAWRLSPAGRRHEIVTGGQETRCRNLHVRDPRLARRLAQALGDVQHVFAPRRSPTDGDLHAFIAGLIAEARTGEPPQRPDWLEEARAAVLDEVAPVAAIAARFRVSREHFARLFAAASGRSPAEARRAAATARAVALIREGEMPLAELALEAGFFDQAHMNRAVREQTGATPGALRGAAAITSIQ